MSRENHIYEPDWSGRTDQLCSVNKPVIKKDALALVTGKVMATIVDGRVVYEAEA